MTTTTAFILPFGKHRGASITEVPSDYLVWLADPERLGQWYPETKAAIEAEVARRAQFVPQPVEAVAINTEMLVAAGARALRQKFVGDLGAQRAIARVAAEVREALSKPAWLAPDPTEEIPF